MATIYEEVEALKTQVATLQSDVNTLTSTMNILQSAIATLQSNINDTGWLNLPLASGIQAYGASVPQYRKIGNIVAIRGAVKNVVASGVIATLPTGFRPSYSVPYVQNTSMRTGNFAMFSRMLIGSDGNVRVEAITDGAEFGDEKWFPVHCIFVID